MLEIKCILTPGQCNHVELNVWVTGGFAAGSMAKSLKLRTCINSCVGDVSVQKLQVLVGLSLIPGQLLC